MKADKLYYQIFLSYPALLADLIPGLPPDCEFEYVAPVIKESEFRLDGLLMPLTDDPDVPVVFLKRRCSRALASMDAILPRRTCIFTSTK